MDDGFGHWLAGFIDGEGCFYISPQGSSYRPQFTLRLRADDAEVLWRAARETGIGTVGVAHVRTDNHPSVSWNVNRKDEQRQLCAILDAYPLRAKKSRDLAVWRLAVEEWCRETPDWTRMAELRDELRAGRTFDAAIPLLDLTVYGRAAPAGSKSGFLHPHTKRVIIADSNPKAKDWKNRVAAEAGRVWAEQGYDLLDGALSVEFLFVRARPRSHYGSGRNADRVKDSAPAYPITRPDVTKLTRGTEDALTGVVWTDDAAITEQRSAKVYGEPERVEVRVWRASAQAVADLAWDERREAEQQSLLVAAA